MSCAFVDKNFYQEEVLPEEYESQGCESLLGLEEEEEEEGGMVASQ